MDPLRFQAMKALSEQTTGDPKTDEAVNNAKNYMVGFLRRLDQGRAEIDAKKNHYTEDGLAHERKALGRKIRREFDELLEKAGYDVEITELRKKLTAPEEETELQTMTRTMREIEARRLMLEAAKDPVQFEATFGPSIAEGNPILISAIENSPIPIAVSPETLKQGQQRRSENANPFVASRLETLERAQSIIDSLSQVVSEEIGNDPEKDLIVKHG